MTSNAEKPDSAGVWFPPPFIYLTGLVAGIVLSRFVPVHIMPVTFARPIGIVLLLAAFVVFGTAVTWFRRLETPISPREPVNALISGGIYRRTRNPLYISLALLYSGITLLFNSLWALLLLIPVLAIIRFIVIAREESYLERRFGAAYLEYKARVPRWF